MTATFLLPFAVGACAALGGNVITDAFGVVAMVAMTPLIAIQVLGLIYTIKQKKHIKDVPAEISEAEEEIVDISTVSENADDDIIDL